MFCRKCGQEIKEGARFCTKCGTEVPQLNQAAQTGQSSQHGAPEQNPVVKAGQPVSVTEKEEKKKGKILPLVIICVIVLALLAGVIVFVVGEKSRGEEDAWEETRNRDDKDSPEEDAASETEDGTSKAEDGTESEAENIEEAEALSKETANENEGNALEKDEKTDMTLEEYAQSLGTSPINGMQYHFTKSESGMDMYVTEGLKGGRGVISYTITDLDRDNQDELLVFWMEENAESGNDVWVQIYEETKEGIVKADEMQMESGLFGPYCDSADARFMVVNGQYISMDFQQRTYLAADGVSLGMIMLSYDGTVLSEYLREKVAGSDFYQVGQERSDTLQKLRQVNLNRTAENLELRDNFTFCVADSGISVLAKIRIDNSYSFEQRDTAPVATCHLIDAKNAQITYILPSSADTYLTPADIKGLDAAWLRIARNEIYARYGWTFDDVALRDYFLGLVWYMPANASDVSDDQLTEVEIFNRDLIKSAE